jgi:hypothetical protein
MNIYFSGSIAGGMDDSHIYQSIISELQVHGNVLTEHLWNSDLHAGLKQGIYPVGMEYLATDHGTYEQDVEWIRQSDIVIAEVSMPSIGVGYEISYAESRSIPVICLYREGCPKRISAMIAGNKYIRVIRYSGFTDLYPQLFANLFEFEKELRHAS